MNLKQRRIAALTMAVKKAVVSVGFKAIKSSEFFGMKQSTEKNTQRKAA